MAALNRATGNLGTVDGIVAALANRRTTMNAADFQRLLDDLASSNSVR